jgi:hypothetical protein
VEAAFRVAVGGCWGAVMERLLEVRPRWAAQAVVGLVLPAAAHAMEYGLLRAAGVCGLERGMAAGVVFSAVALAVNFGLMQRGLLRTGAGAGSLGEDAARMAGVARRGLRCIIRMRSQTPVSRHGRRRNAGR